MIMRPEIELMLKCARNWADEEADARIAELKAGPIDWDFLLRIAERHRMKPFLYWNLKEDHSESVPPSVWEKLETRFRANARANMLALGRMFRLLEKFKEADIPVIAFKGPVSTYTLYSSPGLREFTDLDLLVNPEDVKKSYDHLIASGLTPLVLLKTNQLKALVRFRNDLIFSASGMPFHVDLYREQPYQHYSLEERQPILWERSVATATEDRPARTLAPQDFLFHLGMRAEIGGWPCIYRIIDLIAGLSIMFIWSYLRTFIIES